MYSDRDGHLAFLLITAGIGLLVGFGIASYKDYKEDEKWFNGNVLSYVGWSLGGAVVGALLGATIAATLAGQFTASFGQIITGTKALITLQKSAGLAAVGYAIADNWNNSIHCYTHVFWSGGELAENGGRYVANDVGGKTLEMTKLGNYLQSINANLNSWEQASKLFANQVSSNSTVFFTQNIHEYYNLSIWATIEEPILTGKAVDIIRIIFGG